MKTLKIQQLIKKEKKCADFTKMANANLERLEESLINKVTFAYLVIFKLVKSLSCMDTKKKDAEIENVKNYT